MGNTLTSLTIFFPAYNDEKTIGELVQKVYRVGGQITKDFEILVIDDGSQDGTWKILEGLKKSIPVLKTIAHSTNLGYGAALRTGFTHASKDFVFYTDGDGQYDPEELLKLVDKMKDTIDVVNGYKIKRADPYYRVVIGKLYNWLCHMEYKLPIRDVQCDFRLIRRSALTNIDLHSESGAFCLELVLKLKLHGARFAQVPVHHYPRRFGSSQFFHPYRVARSLYHHARIYMYNKTFKTR